MFVREIRRALGGYIARDDGAAASEVALMLLILGACAATALHAMGVREARFVLSLNDFLASHPLRG